jgi:hypothetical protein
MTDAMRANGYRDVVRWLRFQGWSVAVTQAYCTNIFEVRKGVVNRDFFGTYELIAFAREKGFEGEG